MDEQEITCEESLQAAPKPRRRRSTTPTYRDPGSIAGAFASVVSVFQRSPVSALAVTAILAAASLTYAAYSSEGFRNALVGLLPAAPTLEQQASKVRKDIRREDAVCNLVETVGKRISAHRLVYFRYSGESTPTMENPLPWRYVSAVCVYPKPGVDYDITGAQGMPASLSSELQTVMFPVGQREGACGKWYPEDIKGAYMRSRFDKNGTDLKIACGQVSPQGLPVGSLGADWLSRSAIAEDTEEIEKAIRETIETIIQLQQLQR